MVRHPKNDITVRISLSLPMSLLDAIREEQEIMQVPLSTCIARLVKIGMLNRKDTRLAHLEGGVDSDK